jgi:hypothetical protein
LWIEYLLIELIFHVSYLSGLQVEKERQKDAEKSMEIAQALEGFVGRKVSQLSSPGRFFVFRKFYWILLFLQVVKQTVMTIVYGVTRYGAKAQIQGQLADIKNFPPNKSWPAAAYLAGKTFDSIKQMFTSARQIQVDKRHFCQMKSVLDQLTLAGLVCRLSSTDLDGARQTRRVDYTIGTAGCPAIL